MLIHGFRSTRLRFGRYEFINTAVAGQAVASIHLPDDTWGADSLHRRSLLDSDETPGLLTADNHLPAVNAATSIAENPVLGFYGKLESALESSSLEVV